MRRIEHFLEQEDGVYQRLKRRFFVLPARRAKPASVAFNAFKTLVQGSLMALTFLLAGPFLIWHLETVLLKYGWPLPRFFFPAPLAFILFGLGLLVAWSSAWILVRHGDGTPLPLDATNKLVVRGPYRWVRNPMACASLLEGAALGLWLGSPLIELYILAGGVLWNFSARLWEEHDLEVHFGEEYRRYKRAVRCWIPRDHPYSPPNCSASDEAT